MTCKKIEVEIRTPPKIDVEIRDVKNVQISGLDYALGDGVVIIDGVATVDMNTVIESVMAEKYIATDDEVKEVLNEIFE